MDPKNDDEDPDKKLDSEFRRILRIIRVYIPSIMNLNYLSSYRIWLDKLSEADSSEKEERNRYLFELGRQIEAGVLEPPFTHPPTLGPLIPLNKLLRFNSKSSRAPPYLFPEVTFIKQPPNENPKSTDINFMQNSAVSKTEKQNQEQIQFENYASNLSKNEMSRDENIIREQNRLSLGGPPSVQQSNTSNRMRARKTTTRKEITTNTWFNYQEPSNPIVHKTEEFYNINPASSPQHFPTNTNYYLQDERRQHDTSSERLKNVVYYEAVLPHPDSLFLNLNPAENTRFEHQNLLKNMPQQESQDQIDESSWCDMSDISRTISKVDLADSPKSSEQPQVTEIKKFDTSYGNPITELMNIVTELKKHNLSLSEKAEIIIGNLSQQIQLLKDKAEKSNDTKHQQLIDSSSQWQTIVKGLNDRLNDIHSQNVELTNEVANLKTKLDEFSTEKQQELAIIRQRLSELYNRDVETLKFNYIRQIIDIENKFASILTEKENTFDKRLNELRDIYDKKIEDARNDVVR